MIQIISFFIILLANMNLHIFVVVLVITLHNSICLYSIEKISAFIDTLNYRIKVSYYYLSLVDEQKNENKYEKVKTSKKEN